MTAILCLCLAVSGTAADAHTLSDSERSQIDTGVRELTARALGEARPGYRLAVLEAGQLSEPAAEHAALAPLYAAIYAALGQITGLEVLGRDPITELGRERLAAPEPTTVEWVVALGTAVGADGVLLLPGRVREQELIVTAQWIDVAQQKLVAAAPIKATALVPTTDGDCRATSACSKQGLCTAHGGGCIAGSDADCRRAGICALGSCSARGGRCVAATNADCEHTKLCGEAGKCIARGGRCVDAEEAVAMAAGPPPAAPGPLRPRPPTVRTGPTIERRSVIMMAAGIGMCGAGGIGAGVGAIVIALGSIKGAQTCTGSGATESCRPITDAERRTMRDVGVGILIASGIVAVAGIPVAIIGGWKIPVEPPRASAVPEVDVGPGSVSLTWHI